MYTYKMRHSLSHTRTCANSSRFVNVAAVALAGATSAYVSVWQMDGHKQAFLPLSLALSLSLALCFRLCTKREEASFLLLVLYSFIHTLSFSLCCVFYSLSKLVCSDNRGLC